MLNIEYSDKAFFSVDNFILHLKNYYKKIYFDTGIVDEHLIVSQYITKTEELFDEIINKIEEVTNKGIYGVVLNVDSKSELSKLVIGVRSYNISVIIKKEQSKITIENISFN